jgi:hypothetical protein
MQTAAAIFSDRIFRFAFRALNGHRPLNLLNINIDLFGRSQIFNMVNVSTICEFYLMRISSFCGGDKYSTPLSVASACS